MKKIKLVKKEYNSMKEPIYDAPSNLVPKLDTDGSSTAEKYLKIINKYGRHVVLISMYKGWQEDKGFILDELLSYYRTFINKLKEEIPFETLTESDLRVMGFVEWDNEKHLFLIPLLLWEYSPDGTEVTSIMDEKYVKGKDKISDDTRDGYLAYGITPPVK